jgi:carboxymethylenebutenolidase
MTISQQWVETQGLRGYFCKRESKSPALLVFMEAFGLNHHIQSVTHRLAQAGYSALAPDFFHGDTYAYTAVDQAIAKISSLDQMRLMDEAKVWLDFLAQDAAVFSEKIGVIGFCFGGRLAFLANAVLKDKLSVAVSFYGGGIGPDASMHGLPGLLNQAPPMQAPIFLFYGAEDPMILPGEHGNIAKALSENKKRYSMHVFPKAGHGFFCEERESYNPEAAKKAWSLVLEHLQEVWAQ